MSLVTERIVNLRLTPNELQELRWALQARLTEFAGGDDHTPDAHRARVMRKLLDQVEVARRPTAVTS